jgi:elongation factor Ts
MKETTNKIRQLHEQTGASYLESKKYLEKAGGDAEHAAALLYEKGISLAGKRSARLTKTGRIEAYVHAGSRIGVMLELRCETDLTSSTETFRKFARDMAMHIAAMNPSSINDLLGQSYYRDPDKGVNETLLECIAALKENVEIRRFVRYEVGE